ncbi:MAG: translation initiation factor IF-2, partial [Armatimonadetes bacterium]|nr:translation initiation factor IF-2 [Candidatus Hippobium faecium]
MKDITVKELAKELNITLKEISSVLKDLGLPSRANDIIPAGDIDAVKEVIEAANAPIQIPQTVTVRDLAEKISISAGEIQKTLVNLGILATLNQSLSADIAKKVAEKFNIKLEVKQDKESREEKLRKEKEKEKANQKQSKTSGKLQSRPPVVTVMGHVDHGKTTLLDAYRQTHVTDTEFGGITQHIGAYQVELQGRKITFLDTPGHAAFTQMRARGASVTDIAILVVAADDAVMPQTIEAIQHAKAANVPIIVAINKIDKEGANPERCKQQLMEHGLMCEEWGGDTICVEISAKKKINLDELLEMVLLVADMAELKAEVSASKVQGAVIEAHMEQGRGVVATVLIQKGTLKVGTSIVAGESYGKVRAMFDYKGEKLMKAGPSTPVEITGLNTAPGAGDIIVSVKNDKEAKQIADKRAKKSKDERLASKTAVTLEDLYAQIQAGNVKKLPVVLKADVQGTLEAVKQSLEQIEHEEVKVDIIYSGIGNITENDVMFATTGGAIIVGFNVSEEPGVTHKAETEKVELRNYNVIYELMKDVKGAMAGLLEPV